MKTLKIIIFCLLVLLSSIVLCSCTSTGEKQNDSPNDTLVSGDLIIFHAGSLAIPIKEISTAFCKKYPDVKILTESAGSVACARKITDLGKMCDVFISADYNVINKMLIPQFATWNIKFAGNEMTIVFNEKSKYAGIINKENWFDILLRDDVRYARSDPDSDPCGYRSILTLKLAEKHYHKNGLAESFLNKDRRYIRPKEVDLLALLETNTVDYIFLYRSVAVQHNLLYLELPNQINLKTDSFADFYSQVSVEINGEKPGLKEVFKGETMAYGITIPSDASNKKAALTFVDFLLSKEGIKIIKQNGQNSLIPSVSATYEDTPEILKKYVVRSEK